MKLFYTLVFIYIPFTFLNAQPAESDAEDVAYWKEAVVSETPGAFGDNGFQFDTENTAINSAYADYGVGFFRDKFIYYSANRIGGLTKKDPATNEPYMNLYCSDVDKDGNLSRPLLFSHVLNKNGNLGGATFTEDQNTIYFTKSSEEESHLFALYKAVMDPERPGKWIDIEALPFNKKGFSIENPHLSKDNKTLYFAANFPESKGGFDLFSVAIKADGSYGAPKPLDGTVNTSKDEKFPHISPDGKLLFFSSKGHESIGGYDVFRSRLYANGFHYVVNLGNTLNTEKDEIGYTIARKNEGYYTSNKQDGTGGYDIYQFYESIVAQSVVGVVIDATTNKPLANIAVSLIDADGNQVAITTTTPEGRYEFPVEGFEAYTIIATKNGFDRNDTSFNTETKLKPVFETNIVLRPTPAPIVVTEDKSYLEVKNIQFDYNSVKILEPATFILRAVVLTMQEHPEIKVQLNAHSDSRGGAAYNLKLSEQRAQAAASYLTSKGISKDRIVAKGFGETQPLVDCENCSEKENEINRRIEFIIQE